MKIKHWIIYYRETQRGWAIIMPDEIRIDTWHGFPHIHFSQEDKKHKNIKSKDMQTVLKKIRIYLTKNDKILKEELKEAL